MDVILLERIRNLGNLGDTVKVKPGYGRNYLIPQGKAAPSTKANQEKFETRRAELEQAQADLLARMEAQATRLADLTVVIPRKVGSEGKLFGSVNSHDIADAVTEAGVEISRHTVSLPEGPIRQTGEFDVEIHLHADIASTVNVHVIAEE